MRIIVFVRGILIQIAVATIFAGAAYAASADEMAIRAARDISNRAIAAHDLDGVASVWLPEYSSVTSANVQSSGRDAARARFAQNFATRPDITYVRSPTAITVNTAWGHAGENGRFTGSWTQDGEVTKIGGIYLAKWKKTDGRWMLLTEVFVQTTCSGKSYCAKAP